MQGRCFLVASLACAALSWLSPTWAAEAAASAASAASAAPADDERLRIAAERTAAEERFLATERECNRHFVVTSCVNDAKRTRRLALDQLRSRQLVLDEARRREHAAARRKELADKADDDARRDSARAQGAASAASAPGNDHGSALPQARDPVSADGSASAAADPRRAHDKTRAAAPIGLPRPHVPDSAATRQDREKKSRDAYDKRQLEASEHRDEATGKTARRVAAKTPSASLPASAASSAAPAASAAASAPARR